MLKKHVGDKWYVCIVIVFVIQVLILQVPDNITYWNMYDTSNDVLFILFSICLFHATPYSDVFKKSVAAAFSFWIAYIGISNTITDYIYSDIAYSSLISVFIIIGFMVVFLFRYGVKWSNKNRQITPNNLYLITSKPTNFSQMIVAIYSGRGGGFGITNGRDIWRFSELSNSMIRVPLDDGYTSGRKLEKIGPETNSRIMELDDLIGTEFSLFNNCLALDYMAQRWHHE